jgi:hypothetical protein
LGYVETNLERENEHNFCLRAGQEQFPLQTVCIASADYFEQPEAAKTAAARVPLENLFRVLEMYRNDTFSDESRLGVLELGELQNSGFINTAEDKWYTEIKNALTNAVHTTFAAEISKEAAVRDLQASIRWLVKGGTLQDDSSPRRARAFFGQLSATLSE